MFLFVVIGVLACVFFIMSLKKPVNISGKRDEKIHDLQLRVRAYSGLNPELYYSFVNDLTLMENLVDSNTDAAAGYMHAAIEKANKIALYATGVHTYVIDELREITRELGVHVEKRILRTALRNGDVFRPSYT